MLSLLTSIELNDLQTLPIGRLVFEIAAWYAATMTNKEVVIETVRKLPDDATLQQISEEIAILAAIRKGEEAADAGRVIPHEEVKKKLAFGLAI